MAGDDFTLVMASETDWAWDLDAVVAAPRPSRWPRHPDRPGRLGQDDLASVRLTRANRRIRHLATPALPAPEQITVQLYEWGNHPRVTTCTTVQDLLAIGP